GAASARAVSRGAWPTPPRISSIACCRAHRTGTAAGRARVGRSGLVVPRARSRPARSARTSAKRRSAYISRPPAPAILLSARGGRSRPRREPRLIVLDAFVRRYDARDANLDRALRARPRDPRLRRLLVTRPRCCTAAAAGGRRTVGGVARLREADHRS